MYYDSIELAEQKLTKEQNKSETIHLHTLCTQQNTITHRNILFAQPSLFPSLSFTMSYDLMTDVFENGHVFFSLPLHAFDLNELLMIN